MIKNTQFKVSCIGKNKYLLKGMASKKYLLLPIEDNAKLANVSLIVDNKKCKELKVHLANRKIEYVVPLDISEYKDQQIALIIDGVEDDAQCWEHITEIDKFERTNIEKFKPIYHFSPDYGWMNDPNGMFYKDGVFHLCFQYNPYGSTWENMSWGHATSKDLVRWKHQPDVLHRDGFGDMFSGGAIVDKNNDAGFGVDAVIAFYTNAGIGQMQCIAYSLDNGMTFTKYENNPILTSEEADFRDPKVFWHIDSKKWIMLLAVDQHMEIYSSSNLLDWSYESSFGETEGAHGGVWECPDLIELPIEGSKDKRWVLLCNINPGGPFGGSATQYFVGTFDGKVFKNDSPEKTKWMDFGKDFYATVTWANAPQNRAIALGWMSNWQYANQVPTQQFRSANTIPRDLHLFREANDIYLKNVIVPELDPFVQQYSTLSDVIVNREYEIDELFDDVAHAYSIGLELSPEDADSIGFELLNEYDEKVIFSIDLRTREFAMNRAKSGIVDFDPSKTFTNETKAPLFGPKDKIQLQILVDTCSIEIFGNGGRFTMTNLVFPQSPYNKLRFFSRGGSFKIETLQLCTINVDTEIINQ